ncbi:MAG: glycosyltransferase family 2 protein [Deltaproteobacteria bacterium]|nr:glycosyltransferase family 2 protein [Deltaproteobacteria bacterium]
MAEPFPFPFVSILIPARNEGIVIERTVQAMLALNYPKERLEILVIDDASTDDTPEVVEGIAARHRQVKLVRVPEGEGGKGKSRTLNVGLTHAVGDIIAVYDADNRPEPESLYYLVANLVEDQRLAAVLGKSPHDQPRPRLSRPVHQH